MEIIKNIIETINLVTSVEFIEKWQTLIGSAIGPFLAILISAVAFLYKEKRQKARDRKEAIRRTEVALSQTLSHILIAAYQLEGFIERAKIIISGVEKVTDPKSYSLNETNFPATMNIYFDEELIKMRFHSYYLHNKILIVDYLVRDANSNIQQFRYDYERLLEKNERLADEKKMLPPDQRAAYIHNFKGFIKMIQEFVDGLKKDSAQSIAQAKVYNLKLMQNQLWTIWKYEGASFRYFENKKEMENYNGSMKAVDRINKLMEKEATELMREPQERNGIDD